jgi:hypothetical protein
MDEVIIFVVILSIIVVSYILFVRAIPATQYQQDKTEQVNNYPSFSQQCGKDIPKELAIFGTCNRMHSVTGGLNDLVYIPYDGKFTLLTANDLDEINKRLGGWNSVEDNFIDSINELIKRDLWSLDIVNGLECMIKDGVRPALDYAFLVKNSHKEYIKYFGDKVAKFSDLTLEQYKNKYFVKQKCY